MRFGLAKVDDKRNFGLRHGFGAQNTDAARLDHAVQGCGGFGKKPIRLRPNLGLVIGNEGAAERHQVQGQCGFSGTRGPDDDNSTRAPRHTTGMQRLSQVACHTGRPTTKRAPNGSEVMSA